MIGVLPQVGHVVGHDDALTTVHPCLQLSGKSGSGFSVRKRDHARPADLEILQRTVGKNRRACGLIIQEGSAQRETASF
jgi:hypothetical protein